MVRHEANAQLNPQGRGGAAAFKRWWWLLPLALVAVGLAWWLGTRGEPTVSYRTAPVERGSLQATVSASGIVNPVAQVTVGSQVSGQIKELYADFNTRVSRGQPIARIDPETFQYRLRQSQADLEAARASVLNAQANAAAVGANLSRSQLELTNAQRDLKRREELFAQNFISQAELDTVRNLAGTLAEAARVAEAQLGVARAQVKSAQAVVRQREAALAQSQVDLDRTEIRSPVDGVVIRRAVDVGQTVAASLQAPELFVIARNLSDMQVETSIDEADISRIQPQQPVTFTIDAFPGRTFEGRVSQIRKAAISQQNVVTYTVVVPFANPGDLLLPGMTANVRVITESREQALKLPNAALRVRIAGVDVAPPLNGASAAASPLDGANAAPTASPGAVPQSGPLRDLRDRLLAELQLTAEQLARVDGVMAAAATRLVALRDAPQQQRGRAREQILADARTQIGEQLTGEQRTRYQQLLAQSGGRGTASQGRVYTLDAEGRPRAWSVRLGVSDGSTTELLVHPGAPEAQALAEGALVVVGVNSPGTAAPARRAPAGGPRPQF